MEKRIKDLHRVSCVLVFCAQRLQCSKFTKSKFHENLTCLILFCKFANEIDEA